MKSTKDARPYHIRRRSKRTSMRIGLAFIAKKIVHYAVFALFISMVYVLITGEEEPKQPEQSVSTSTVSESKVDTTFSYSFLANNLGGVSLYDEIHPDREIKVTNEDEKVDTDDVVKVASNDPIDDDFETLDTDKYQYLNEKISLEEANLPILDAYEVEDLDVDTEIIDMSIVPKKEEPKPKKQETKKVDKVEVKEEPKEQKVVDIVGNANSSGAIAVVGDRRKSYMDYKKIKAKSSPQYKLQQVALTDANGLRMINGRYCVAVATTYGEVGKCIDVILANGTTIPCIIGDHKSPAHTIANNTLGADGGAVEFIVETNMLPSTVRSSGDVSSIGQFSGQVTNILTYDINALNPI